MVTTLFVIQPSLRSLCPYLSLTPLHSRVLISSPKIRFPSLEHQSPATRQIPGYRVTTPQIVRRSRPYDLGVRRPSSATCPGSTTFHSARDPSYTPSASFDLITARRTPRNHVNNQCKVPLNSEPRAAMPISKSTTTLSHLNRIINRVNPDRTYSKARRGDDGEWERREDDDGEKSHQQMAPDSRVRGRLTVVTTLAHGYSYRLISPPRAISIVQYYRLPNS
ncbi:hypothetical protein HGRIS_000305 [Hohenbuehelia grisea]|uniref:Uncharacterized protein n=1 Tax=Hohenbuehelia grisea TaxID=104357 RepID=A0ABR3JQU0_9AGAR